jgi:hypothetical protein
MIRPFVVRDVICAETAFGGAGAGSADESSSLLFADGLGISPSGTCSDCEVLTALASDRECRTLDDPMIPGSATRAGLEGNFLQSDRGAPKGERPLS